MECGVGVGVGVEQRAQRLALKIVMKKEADLLPLEYKFETFGWQPLNWFNIELSRKWCWQGTKIQRGGRSEGVYYIPNATLPPPKWLLH